jgi:hypothetical protein
MAAINSDTLDAWQKLAITLGTTRPSIGKRVMVKRGKHAAEVGIVTWHGHNKFADWNHLTDAQYHLRELAGRWGYRVQIDTGTEKFFVDADNVEVANPQ